MPSVHVRLTDEQLGALRCEAEENERSMQREIVHRLFRSSRPQPHRTRGPRGRSQLDWLKGEPARSR